MVCNDFSGGMRFGNWKFYLKTYFFLSGMGRNMLKKAQSFELKSSMFWTSDKTHKCSKSVLWWIVSTHYEFSCASFMSFFFLPDSAQYSSFHRKFRENVTVFVVLRDGVCMLPIGDGKIWCLRFFFFFVRINQLILNIKADWKMYRWIVFCSLFHEIMKSFTAEHMVLCSSWSEKWYRATKTAAFFRVSLKVKLLLWHWF